MHSNPQRTELERLWEISWSSKSEEKSLLLQVLHGLKSIHSTGHGHYAEQCVYFTEKFWRFEDEEDGARTNVIYNIGDLGHVTRVTVDTWLLKCFRRTIDSWQRQTSLLWLCLLLVHLELSLCWWGEICSKSDRESQPIPLKCSLRIFFFSLLKLMIHPAPTPAIHLWPHQTLCSADCLQDKCWAAACGTKCREIQKEVKKPCVLSTDTVLTPSMIQSSSAYLDQEEASPQPHHLLNWTSNEIIG